MRGAVLLALVLAGCGSSSSPPPAATPAADVISTSPHARNTCADQSGADFPGAFTSPRNVVHGPLVLVGAAYTDPATVREFGGNKFPLLVRAGHNVTITIGPDARAFARLAYGPHFPSGREVRLRDAFVSETFVACRPGKSISTADGEEVTFWSGFVLAGRPACVPLDVSVDRGPIERFAIALGARC